MEPLLPALLELQPMFLRILQHPDQGDIRQAALVVPPADVRMYACEPDLYDILIRRQIILIPDAAGKFLPLFIDRDCMVSVCHIRIEPVVEEFFAIPPAERANGIPHPDEMRLAGLAIGFLESRGDAVIATSVVNVAGVGDQIDTALLEEPDFVEHTRQATYREGAAAEAEHE